MSGTVIGQYENEGVNQCYRVEEAPDFIDLVLKGGNRKALKYVHLHWITFSPSHRTAPLQLQFATHTVTIQGRNLQRLYENLLKGNVAEISVAAEHLVSVESVEPLVTEIHAIQNPTGTGMAGRSDTT